MSFLNNFVSQVLTGDDVRSWQHATRIFVDNNYNLSPKYGFLFHVAFDFNPDSAICRLGRQTQLEAGMLAKTVNLPRYSFDTKTLNAYNRPNIVQNKIKYDTVSMTFHDDNADTLRQFWYDYYTNYYRDSDYQMSSYFASHKYDNRTQGGDWGYTPRKDRSNNGTGKPDNYIRAIRIYSLHQKKFTEYVLVNPTIKSFKFGEHSNSDSTGLMQVDLLVDYETVLYSYGSVSPSTVKGFAELHYDKGPSPLTAAGGGTNSIIGPGGLIDSGLDVVQDMSQGDIGSAIFKGARTVYNNKGQDLSRMAIEDLKTVGKGILTGGNPFSNVTIPSLSSAFFGKPNTATNRLDMSSGVDSNSNATPGSTQAAAAATGLAATANKALDSAKSWFSSSTAATSNNSNVSSPFDDPYRG